MGESRTTLVEQNERLTQALRILTESYQLALATLVILHNKYMRSKEVKNIFNRYSLMREMIKVNLNKSYYFKGIFSMSEHLSREMNIKTHSHKLFHH